MGPVFAKLAAAFVLAAMALGVSAQNYPERPVRLVVPFPPGTATDLAARVIGERLQATLGQPFVVDNKPGAGGSIAGSEVVRSAPDGYTLMFSSNSAVASKVALLRQMPYDPLKDFTPVAGVGRNVLVLMVRSDFPARDLKGFIEHARQRAGRLTAGYGSSSSQVCISMLDKMAGIETLPVPYKGIPLAVNDLIGGQIDFGFADLGNAIAQARGGKLRPLAVTSEKRNPLVPDWPTLAELLPGYDITAWFAIVGPAGLPRPVVDRLHAATVAALAAPDSGARFATIGLAPMPLAPDALMAFMASEITKWRRLVKEANIQPE